MSPLNGNSLGSSWCQVQLFWNKTKQWYSFCFLSWNKAKLGWQRMHCIYQMHGTHIVLWRGTTPPEYTGLKLEMRNSTLSNRPLETRASEIISHSTPWLLDPCIRDIAPYGSLIFNTHIPFVGKPPGDRDVYQWQEHLPSMGEALVLLLELPKTNEKQNKTKTPPISWAR